MEFVHADGRLLRDCVVPLTFLVGDELVVWNDDLRVNLVGSIATALATLVLSSVDDLRLEGKDQVAQVVI